MPRKLPPPSRHYPTPSLVSALTFKDTKEFSLFAYFETVATLVRLVRMATHDDAANKTKYVVFHIAPEAVLLGGRPLYARPEFADLRIRCEWSPFLRLVRWRKDVDGMLMEDQARIARVMPATSAEYPYVLEAVDDPIRKRNKKVRPSNKSAG